MTYTNVQSSFIGKTLKLDQPELEPVLAESAPCLLRLENVDETVWELSVDLL